MSQLRTRFESGQFVVTSELTPPKGVSLDALFEKAQLLRHDVHAFNVTDSHAARMSMAPIAAAHLLLNRGIEPILQMTTRDRNRIALQGDMLAASALGITNLTVMGGDPPTNGDHPDAKAVFDVYASQLLAAAKSMERGTDMSGHPLLGAPRFFLGAVANPGAPNLDEEVARLQEKVAAGAEFVQTQAVYEPAPFERFARQIEDLGVPVLAGIIPVRSRKMARYMNEHVPGIHIPEDVVSAIEDASNPSAKSVELSAGLIRALRPLCQGVHIMAIGWEAKIPDILAQI